MNPFMVLRAMPAYLAFVGLKDKEKIKMDLRRFSKDVSLLNLAEVLKVDKVYRRIFLERIRSENKPGYYIVRCLYKPESTFGLGTKIDAIGGGMRVYHGTSTVVHCKSIGENFSVYQNVTLGKGKLINGESRPTIGDNVWVYTGAVVIGGITIGNNCKIGAGAVVNKDVPDNCTVVGNPMRIIQN